MSIENIEVALTGIPDFPKPGIIFKDITPILGNAELFKETIELMSENWIGKAIDAVAAIDARGFIFGSAIALELDAGFIPIRKSGKLPWEIYSAEYDLEYGTNCVEMHRDACTGNQRILLVDDLLATGGTAKAAVDLIEKTGAEIVGIQFLMELNFLQARHKMLKDYNVQSVLPVD